MIKINNKISKQKEDDITQLLVKLKEQFLDEKCNSIDSSKIEKKITIENLLIETFKEISNLHKEISNLKYSIVIALNSNNIISDLPNDYSLFSELMPEFSKKNLSFNYHNLIDLLNQKLKDIKKIPEKEYSLLCSTCINFTDEKIITRLNDLLIKTDSEFISSFQLISKYNLFKIKDKIKGNFIKIKLKARHENYAFNKFLDMKSILHIIPFLKLYNHTHYKDNFLLDSRIINEYTYSNYILLENSNILAYELNDINYSNANYIFWKLDEKIISSLEKIWDNLKNKKPDFVEFIFTIFKNYYSAVSEKNFALVFLNFFILIEKILKNGNKVSDQKMKSFLKKMMVSKVYKNYIDLIFKKRNLFVHEYSKDLITQSDVLLIKTIAENLINATFINPIIKVNNKKDLSFLINHLTLSEEEAKYKKDMLVNFYSASFEKK